MARKGRQLEILIEKLEKSSLPEGANIISPGFLQDKVTGQQREVDILIEYKVGTTPISIIIECRDRKSPQDTQWIEQINTKIHDLNINKAIAVASNGFTNPAIKKASHYGIETRIFSEVDIDIISSWWSVQHIGIYSRNFKIYSAFVETEKEKLFEDYLKSKTFSDKFINRTIDDNLFSVNDIFGGISPKIPNWRDLTPNGKPLLLDLDANFSNPKDCFIINNKNESSRIINIKFKVLLRIIAREEPISRVSSYRNDEKTISEVIEFDNVPMGENQILQIIRNEDGSITMSSRKK